MGNRGDLAARSPATARRDRRAASRRRCALRGAGTAAIPGDDPCSERSFLEELLGGHHYLAARAEDGQLVGYAGVVFVTGPPQAEAEIQTIGVDPAHQGRGVGRPCCAGCSR